MEFPVLETDTSFPHRILTINDMRTIVISERRKLYDFTLIRK